jgi:hypothetical protein
MGLFLRMRDLNLPLNPIKTLKNAMILGYRSDNKRQKVKSHAETEKMSSGQCILLQCCLLPVSIYGLKALGTVAGLLLTETEEYILIAE